MTISSPAFSSNTQIPIRYTCESVNVSPPLQFSDVPEDAKSLVLAVTDPDAPANPWIHWLVFNIPPEVRKFDEGIVPPGGIEGYANGGKPGYEGPCPPTGTHRYVFTLYALGDVLDLPASSNYSVIMQTIESNRTLLLETAELVGIYKKQNAPTT